MQRLLKIKVQEVTTEGLVIFSMVAYETLALTANFLLNRKVLLPITDILGPMTHSKFGKIFVWLLLGWLFDHFWKRGEASVSLKLLTVTDEQ